VIDLTGEFTSLDQVDAAFLLTERSLIARKSDYETRAFDLSGVEDFEIDRQRVEDWLGTARWLFFPVLYPICLGFSLAYRLLQVLIYGAIGIGFAKVLNLELPYFALVRISTLAITPVLVLDTAMDLLKFHLPLWWLLAWLIAMAYLFFGVGSNRPAMPVPPQVQVGTGT
jgi:hypothetical protein